MITTLLAEVPPIRRLLEDGLVRLSSLENAMKIYERQLRVNAIATSVPTENASSLEILGNITNVEDTDHMVIDSYTEG